VLIERKDALRYGFDPAANNNAEVGNRPHFQGIREDSKLPSTSQAKGASVVVESQPLPNIGSVLETPSTCDAQNPTPTKHLTLLSVVTKLARSNRALVAFFMTLVYGYVTFQQSCSIFHNLLRRIAYSSQEPALPLHLQAIWGLKSSKVGLVFLAAVVPTLFCKSMNTILEPTLIP
jgi:hypothetical protein